MSQIQLRHGIFLPPFHPMDENPAACMDRDLELMQWLDRLGFHEAWIGEHHSAGWETISSPELFIAVAAERTRSIRFGTGVISLPYHNPLMTANRIIQLDHHTRGRVMFGAGPGLLASDALMLGIDPNTQRDRMAEALDVILRFFQRRDRHREDRLVHLRQRSRASASVYTAASRGRGGQRGHAVGRTAGRQVRPQHDLRRGDQSVRLRRAGGQLADRQRHRRRAGTHDGSRAAAPGRADAHRRNSAKAFENCRFGFERYLGYLNNNQPRFIVPSGQDAAEWFVENKFGVIGTPDDAIALIERLQAKQGEFGVFLHQAHNWADWERPSAPTNCMRAT